MSWTLPAPACQITGHDIIAPEFRSLNFKRENTYLLCLRKSIIDKCFYFEASHKPMPWDRHWLGRSLGNIFLLICVRRSLKVLSPGQPSIVKANLLHRPPRSFPAMSSLIIKKTEHPLRKFYSRSSGLGACFALTSLNLWLPVLFLRSHNVSSCSVSFSPLVFAEVKWRAVTVLLSARPRGLLRCESYIIFYETVNLFAIKFRLSHKTWWHFSSLFMCQ